MLQGLQFIVDLHNSDKGTNPTELNEIYVRNFIVRVLVQSQNRPSKPSSYLGKKRSSILCKLYILFDKYSITYQKKLYVLFALVLAEAFGHFIRERCKYRRWPTI